MGYIGAREIMLCRREGIEIVGRVMPDTSGR